MNKISLKNTFLPLLLLLFSLPSFAQSVVSGTIIDEETKEPLIGVSLKIKGKVIGTITDLDGKFEINTVTPPPYYLVVSYVGYQSQEVLINETNANVSVSLKDQAIQGQEVVVSASRVEESVLRSSAAVEKMDIRDIQQNTSASFYDGLINKKGIDMTTQGLLFKSINMRGFGATGNPRTVQMIDGMDNQAPGLNFPIDNIVGMPELDVESVEILPGAASALYGPNALNGLILMNSKSPFLYQGLSANLKTGIMVADNRSTKTTPLYDFSVRYAKAINDKFAFKVNLSYLTADDWEATDYTNLNSDGSNPAGIENGMRGAGVNTDYDGLNVYGDEVQANMQTVAAGLNAAGLLSDDALALIPSTNVSRTGFLERDLLDYGTKSFKANTALHYRLNEKMELIGQFNYGYGTTAYTGTGRYSLRNFNLSQFKLELRGDNFKLRAYTTQERSGDSYVAGLAAVSMLNEIKPHATWFGQYTGAYAQAVAQGASPDQAHIGARQFADAGMPQPGSSEYNTIFERNRDQTISAGGGASFNDKSNLYHFEGVYDFKNEITWADVLVGGNIRQYQLSSNGTLFADLEDGRSNQIKINEYGAFVQAARSMFNDHFKLTGSIRYDKNENFEGQFSPKIAGVFSFGQNNIRVSYQTGFRIPTTQNQYIQLATPSGTLLGGLEEFNGRFNLLNGIPLQVLTDFSQNQLNSQYLDPTKINRAVENAKAYATAAVTPFIPQIQAGVIEAVQGQITQGVTAAVQGQITQAVTAAINAAVEAGQIAADQAAAAIAAQVAAQLALPATQAAIAQGVQDQLALPATQAAIGAEVQNQVVTRVTAVATQVTPAYLTAELPKYTYKKLKPERIYTFEVGYKGLIAKKLFLDAYYYHSTYKDFIGGTSIVVPTEAAGTGLPIESGVASASTRLGYSRPANTDKDITVQGWAASLDYSLPKGFNIGGNIAFNDLTGFQITPEQQYAGFNTPKYRYGLSFGKKLGSRDKVGFNVNFRHQDEFIWESSFSLPTTASVDAFARTIVPAINNIDAQVSFKVPAIKSIIKVGGTNIGGDTYIQAYGSPAVGSMYYVSIGFDQLLNR